MILSYPAILVVRDFNQSVCNEDCNKFFRKIINFPEKFKKCFD